VRHHRVVAALLLASSVLTPALSVAPVLATADARQIAIGGTAQLPGLPTGLEGGVSAKEFATTPEDAREGRSGDDVPLRDTGPGVPAVIDGPQAPGPKVPPTVGLNFEGLNHRQQRLANGGKQFSLEPPDQGLCVGNEFILETVNDVLRVFNRTTGAPLTGVIDLNTFYGYPAQIVRATPGHPAVQGPFITDPSCWFDAPTQRFFHVVLTLDVNPATGAFLGSNHLDLAVTQTADPTGAWNIYRLPVQDDGTDNTPNHHCAPGVPPASSCIGDFPHMGADKYGFYLTTNEYCLSCPDPIGFHAAQVYAFDKRALARGDQVVTFRQFDTLGMDNGKPGFTLFPATTPGDQDFELFDGGTEYFTSSNAAEEAVGIPNSQGLHHSNQIVVWALTNTSAVKANFDLRLHNSPVTVDDYSIPDRSNQKPGAFPLGQCINDTTAPTQFGPGCWQNIFVNEPAHNEVEGTLDSSDSRVLSTTFVRGMLWGTLDTNVKVEGKTKAGILFYIIIPHLGNAGSVTGSLVRQGHVVMPNNNAIYGTVAATPSGKAVISFTLVGDDHFPSAAFVSLNSKVKPAHIQIIQEGVGPQDGFSEYKAFRNPPRPRWGDYGAAVAFDDNTFYLAAESIHQTCTLAQYMAAPFGSCGGTRTSLANWSTHVTRVNVGP
jgi:hypothetical protein